MTTPRPTRRIRTLAQQIRTIGSAIPDPDSPEALWERLGARQVPDQTDIQAFIGPETVQVMKSVVAALAQDLQHLAQLGLELEPRFSLLDKAAQIAATPPDLQPSPDVIQAIQHAASGRPRTQDRDTPMTDFPYRRYWTALAVTAALGAPDGRPLRDEIAAGRYINAAKELDQQGASSSVYSYPWNDSNWQRLNCQAIKEHPDPD